MYKKHWCACINSYGCVGAYVYIMDCVPRLWVCARTPWLIAQRPGLLSGGFELTWTVACGHQTWCMLVWCAGEITPNREVDKSGDTNLSIWLTCLYYKSLGVQWYCLPQILQGNRVWGELYEIARTLIRHWQKATSYSKQTSKQRGAYYEYKVLKGCKQGR